MQDKLNPAKDVANREKHKLPFAFDTKILEDDNHLIIPSVRTIIGEEWFKVVGAAGEKLFTAVLVWQGGLPCFISVKRSSTGEEQAYRSTC